MYKNWKILVTCTCQCISSISHKYMASIYHTISSTYYYLVFLVVCHLSKLKPEKSKNQTYKYPTDHFTWIFINIPMHINQQMVSFQNSKLYVDRSIIQVCIPFSIQAKFGWPDVRERHFLKVWSSFLSGTRKFNCCHLNTWDSAWKFQISDIYPHRRLYFGD